jgi:hypothetical protein
MVRLKVDYDTSRLPARLAARIGHCVSAAGLRVEWWSLYRTARGWHLQVECRGRAQPFAIVALQAMLGSDWKREAFNIGRVRGLRYADPATRNGWNILFRRKIRVHIKRNANNG